MPISFNLDQLHEYQSRAANGDMEGHYWFGYFLCIVMNQRREASRVWRRALEELQHQKSHDEVGSRSDNTGKIRYRLGFAKLGEEQSENFLRQAVPRLQYESYERGDFESQYLLGLCFRFGYGELQKNDIQAAYCWKLAAEQGHPDAQLVLASCYADGLGVEQDNIQAVEWYDKATMNGCSRAIIQRNCLLDNLDAYERVKVLGSVQRNRWIRSIRETAHLNPSLAIWALVLEKVGSQGLWAGLSPTHICLEEIMPQKVNK